MQIGGYGLGGAVLGETGTYLFTFPYFQKFEVFSGDILNTVNILYKRTICPN